LALGAVLTGDESRWRIDIQWESPSKAPLKSILSQIHTHTGELYPRMSQMQLQLEYMYMKVGGGGIRPRPHKWRMARLER